MSLVTNICNCGSCDHYIMLSQVSTTPISLVVPCQTCHWRLNRSIPQAVGCLALVPTPQSLQKWDMRLYRLLALACDTML